MNPDGPWCRRLYSHCWQWADKPDSNGYGRLVIGGRGGKQFSAHRLTFELVNGPIPEKDEEGNQLDLDHLCRNRICVNPGHLELVTHRGNLLRGETLVAAHARKTHCKSGHEFTPENTWYDKTGARKCRKCMYASNKRYVGRKRVQAQEA